MALLTFDDIRIIPQPTNITSRSQCSTNMSLGPIHLRTPLIVASMHSLVTATMVENVDAFGSMVVQPRGMQDLTTSRVALSTGFDDALRRAAMLPENGILSVEVANGYQKRMLSILEAVKKYRPDLYIMAGTVCTLEGFNMLSEYADGILMGIGVGNSCITTVNTGVGLPAAEMLARVRNRDIDKDIILCGGVKTYGDFVKAIALGADVVMSGYLFKDCTDTGPRYYGEASAAHKEELAYIEGTEVNVTKGAKDSYVVLKEATEALQSAMSYSDAVNLDEFRARVLQTWRSFSL